MLCKRRRSAVYRFVSSATCYGHQVRAFAHLAAPVHARREHGSHDLSADIVQRLIQGLAQVQARMPTVWRGAAA
jgi:hypothetical protein